MLEFLLGVGFEWYYAPDPAYVTEYVLVSGRFMACPMNEVNLDADWLITFQVDGEELVTRDREAIMEWVARNWKP
jgi:hypothetical protein